MLPLKQFQLLSLTGMLPASRLTRTIVVTTPALHVLDSSFIPHTEMHWECPPKSSTNVAMTNYDHFSYTHTTVIWMNVSLKLFLSFFLLPLSVLDSFLSPHSTIYKSQVAGPHLCDFPLWSSWNNLESHGPQ